MQRYFTERLDSDLALRINCSTSTSPTMAIARNPASRKSIPAGVAIAPPETIRYTTIITSKSE